MIRFHSILKALMISLISAFLFSGVFAQTVNPLNTADTSKEFEKSQGTKTSAIKKKSPPPKDRPNQVQREDSSPQSNQPMTASPRVLRKNGLGIGLGQTFLMGDYSDHGDDKISFDAFYSYTASYSFDLLVNAHRSEHSFKSEKIILQGINLALKARYVEFDNFSPYFLGGLGFYAPRAKRIEGGSLKWTKRKLTFGTTFGTGIDLRLNQHYVVGIMAQVHWPFAIKFDDQSKLKGYYSKLLLTGFYLF